MPRTAHEIERTGKQLTNGRWVARVSLSVEAQLVYHMGASIPRVIRGKTTYATAIGGATG